jgi:hypothetical protein
VRRKREILGKWREIFCWGTAGACGGLFEKGFAQAKVAQGDFWGLAGSIANGFRVEVCGIPGPECERPGAPSFVVWIYPGIGATRLNVVPQMIFSVFYPQERGLSWPKMKCLSKGVDREIMR